MLRICSIFVLGLWGSVVAAETVSGVARVIDGDTLAFGARHVRLMGVDAPEMAQTCTREGRAWACGVAARAAMVARLGLRITTCTGAADDRYGRLVAVCRQDGADVAADLVGAGAILAYRRYSMAYVGLETTARAARVGVWAGQVEAPAAFRAARRAGLDLPAAEASAPAAGCAIKGNISGRGRIYHMPGQPDYDATVITPAKGERWFCSVAAAESAGWRAVRSFDRHQGDGR
jgi:endonuclease YncB( thermonuclease family)